ncbi:hypothetical protein PybrP1_006957 [[Pythium] brassicae (nom. inval.)]|nr:hypothetical protein PybrP1_006957 [[Pythium] brassicae (nom. inval.)]
MTAPPPTAQQQRLQKELQAQRARAEALRHLNSTGSGPSQRELARQQAERRQLQSATAARVERFVSGAQTPTTAPTASVFDPRVRDNTLHAVARRRADELQQQQQQQTRRGTGARGARSGALPDGWTEVREAASGDTYYWNERTNETTWDRPGKKRTREEDEDEEEDQSRALPALLEKTLCLRTNEHSGWEAVEDADSGDVYYWHRSTNETSWTRPAPAAVPLAMAVAAKSKLDAILKTCGPSTTSGSTRGPSCETAAPSQSSQESTKRRREQEATSSPSAN